MSIATAYPLTWPPGFPRAKWREAGKFKTTLPAALKNVQDSLRLFAADSGKSLQNLVISSNVTPGAERPQDPGVAIWFVWDGLTVCVPVDRYQTVAANLQAIHHIIEARRVELRHGGLAIVRATFTGFLALPAPNEEPWWAVLQVEQTADRATIEAAWKKLAVANHPDRGGSGEAMARVNAARDRALRERA